MKCLTFAVKEVHEGSLLYSSVEKMLWTKHTHGYPLVERCEDRRVVVEVPLSTNGGPDMSADVARRKDRPGRIVESHYHCDRCSSLDHVPEWVAQRVFASSVAVPWCLRLSLDGKPAGLVVTWLICGQAYAQESCCHLVESP